MSVYSVCQRGSVRVDRADYVVIIQRGRRGLVGRPRSAIRGARTVSASSMIPTPITVRSTAGVARRGHATTDEIATHGLATTAAPTDSTVDIHRQKPVFRQH